MFSHEFWTALRLRSYFSDSLEQGVLYLGRPAGSEPARLRLSRAVIGTPVLFLCVCVCFFCVCARVRVRCVSLVCLPATSGSSRGKLLASHHVIPPPRGKPETNTLQRSNPQGRHRYSLLIAGQQTVAAEGRGLRRCGCGCCC